MSLPSDPTAVYEAGIRVPLKHAALALAVATAGLLLAGVPLLTSDPGGIVVAALCCSLPGVCMTACGVLSCLVTARSIGTRVLVFPDGLEVQRPWSTRYYPWEKMELIYNSGNHAHLGGRDRPPRSYEIGMEDGGHVALAHLSGLGRLGQTIEEETTRRLLPKALGQCAEGRTVCFGRLSVNSQGVIKGEHTLPWGELSSWSFDRDGWLTLEWKGKEWKEWIVVSPNKLFNLHLLLRLLAEFKKDCPPPEVTAGDSSSV